MISHSIMVGGAPRISLFNFSVVPPNSRTDWILCDASINSTETEAQDITKYERLKTRSYKQQNTCDIKKLGHTNNKILER